MQEGPAEHDGLMPRWPIVADGPVGDFVVAQAIAGRLAEMGVRRLAMMDSRGVVVRTLQARAVSLVDELMNLETGMCVGVVDHPTD